MTDPFEQLTRPVHPVAPRADFAQDLRARLVTRLGADPTGGDVIDLPARRPATTGAEAVPQNQQRNPMTDTTTTTERPERHRAAAGPVTPYLAAVGADDALAFYRSAFGAVEHHRVTGPDGRVGHAELTIGTARFYLADSHRELGVPAPTELDGTTVTLHLEVADADMVFQRAVEAGAVALSEPADQPHGARHGTLLDPFGHRWMISQTLRDLDLEAYTAEMAAAGWSVEVGTGPEPAPAAVPRPDDRRGDPGIWASVNARDARAMIRFMVDVLGFTEQLVVPGEEPGVVVHSQLRWPEGGVVQVGSAGREHNLFSQRPSGGDSLYVITRDPMAVFERCRRAGVEVVAEPAVPDYDEGGQPSFAIRDHEGNLWSFGSYAGGG